MISARFAITAAHCFIDDDGPWPPFTAEINGVEYNVIEARVNDCYTTRFGGYPNSADMAILVFDQDIPVTPVDVYDAEI